MKRSRKANKSVVVFHPGDDVKRRRSHGAHTSTIGVVTDVEGRKILVFWMNGVATTESPDTISVLRKPRKRVAQ